MSATQTIDYDALARQHGAISSQPAQIDYDTLAKQHGAISSTPTPSVSPSDASPTGATQEKDPLSPAERRAVNARPGSPLNLQGHVGAAGKFQASMYSLTDYLRNKSQLEGKPLGSSGGWYRAFADPSTYTEMAGDLAGLTGMPGTSLKNALLTGAAVTPYLRTLMTPYFAATGIQTALAGKAPNETQADHVQRILLGSGMAVGSVAGAAKAVSPRDVAVSGEGLKVVPKPAPEVQTVLDFAHRARSVEAMNKGAVGLMQGSIMPRVHQLRAALHNEVERTANTIIDADQRDLSNINQGTIHATPAIKNVADYVEKTAFIPEGAADKLATDLQNSSGMKFRDAKLLRSRIGNAEAAAYRRGDNLTGGYLAAMRKGLDESMQGRAADLGLAKAWDHYNNEAKAMFDLEKGVAGDLLDSTPAPDNIRRLTTGEERAMTLTKKLASGAVSNDLNQMRGWLQKYKIPVEDWDESLGQAKSLAQAHDALSGRYSQGLYRMITSHPEHALIPLGVYMAMHGAGVYGFAPYLAATAVGGGSSSLKSRMDAGRVLRQLGANLPETAFQTMLEAEGPRTFEAKPFDDGPAPKSNPTPLFSPRAATAEKLRTIKGGQAKEVERRIAEGQSPTGTERRASTLSLKGIQGPPAEQVRLRSYYQNIIDDPKSTPRDKAYAQEALDGIKDPFSIGGGGEEMAEQIRMARAKSSGQPLSKEQALANQVKRARESRR